MSIAKNPFKTHLSRIDNNICVIVRNMQYIVNNIITLIHKPAFDIFNLHAILHKSTHKTANDCAD